MSLGQRDTWVIQPAVFWQDQTTVLPVSWCSLIVLCLFSWTWTMSPAVSQDEAHVTPWEKTGRMSSAGSREEQHQQPLQAAGEDTSCRSSPASNAPPRLLNARCFVVWNRIIRKDRLLPYCHLPIRAPYLDDDKQVLGHLLHRLVKLGQRYISSYVPGEKERVFKTRKKRWVKGLY